MKNNLSGAEWSSVIRMTAEDVGKTFGKGLKEATQDHSFDIIIPLICCVDGPIQNTKKVDRKKNRELVVA